MMDTDELFLRGKELYGKGRLLDAASCFEAALIAGEGQVQGFSDLLLTLNYIHGCKAEELSRLHREFEVRYCQEQLQDAGGYTNSTDPERRLRIGYVSPDLRAHAVVFFIAPVLMHHDRSRFEIFAYYNHAKKDKFTSNLQQCCHYWRDIAGLDDEEAAKLIRKDGIDILIDLAGHSAHNCLLAFARKPAPVQVTWLGYPNTTGLSTIDYRLTDALTDPEGVDEQLYTESLYRLPETFLCYSPLIRSPDLSPSPAMKNGYVTYASLNNFSKINPETVMTWVRLLKETPRSRLVLLFNGGNKTWLDNAVKEARSCSVIPFASIRAMGNLLYARKAFEDNGISSERITILGRSPNHAAHLQHYRNIDIALDPFPYNGTTTTFESLWMGVPVISLEGNRHAARVSASISRNLGLEELVGDNVDAYIDAARQVAMDRRKLASLRVSLRNIMSSSCVMAACEFTRNLESAYRIMWKNWCLKQGD
jgi:predicted O-linked N-acetylglucosamine transferase (SPINDLY family)